MDNSRIVKNIEICITNARVELEQGGKYDWSEEFQDCDEWLKTALELLKKIK